MLALLALLFIPGLLLFSIPFLLLEGFVVWKLWEWFAVPIGAPVIHYLAALGLMVLVRFIMPRTIQETKDRALSEHLRIILGAVLNPLFILLVGWMITLFM